MITTKISFVKVPRFQRLNDRNEPLPVSLNEEKKVAYFWYTLPKNVDYDRQWILV